VRDQSDGGDKGVKGAESVEDPVLPPVGLVDLVPPAGNESFHVRHGRQAQWHSRHSALSSPAKSFRTHKSQIILSEKPKLKFTEREREREREGSPVYQTVFVRRESDRRVELFWEPFGLVVLT